MTISNPSPGLALCEARCSCKLNRGVTHKHSLPASVTDNSIASFLELVKRNPPHLRGVHQFQMSNPAESNRRFASNSPASVSR